MDTNRHIISRRYHKKNEARHRSWKAGQADLHNWTERALQIDERFRHPLCAKTAGQKRPSDSKGKTIFNNKRGCMK